MGILDRSDRGGTIQSPLGGSSGGGGGGITWATPVNANIIPDTDVAYTLGSALFRFSEIHAQTAYFTDIVSATSLMLDADGGEVFAWSTDEVFALKSYNGVVAPTLRFWDKNEGFYVGLKSPDTLVATTTYILPAADGTSGQFLQTDGAGTLSFAGAANVTLSNLGTTAINTALIPSGTRNLGDGTNAWATVFLGSGTSAGVKFNSGTFHIGHGFTDAGSPFGSGSAGSFRIRTTSSIASMVQYTANASASGSIQLGTGNGTSGSSGSITVQTGTGTAGSGGISLTTGTVTGGTRGSISLNALSLDVTNAPIVGTLRPLSTLVDVDLGSATNAWQAVYTAQIRPNTGNILGIFGDSGINYDATADKHNFASTGRGIVVPRLSADPGSSEDGEIWYNTTSNQLKAYVNGAVTVITVI